MITIPVGPRVGKGGTSHSGLGLTWLLKNLYLTNTVFTKNVIPIFCNFVPVKMDILEIF